MEDFALLWSQATAGGTDALLGETVLFLAQTHSKRIPSTKATAQLGQALVNQLPYDENREQDWWRADITTAKGLGVWDTRRRQPTPARELVVVAASAADLELSQWVWLGPRALAAPTR